LRDGVKLFGGGRKLINRGMNIVSYVGYFVCVGGQGAGTEARFVVVVLCNEGVFFFVNSVV